MSRTRQRMLTAWICLRSPEEELVVHCATAADSGEVTLDIERRCPTHGIKFERVSLPLPTERSEI